MKTRYLAIFIVLLLLCNACNGHTKARQDSTIVKSPALNSYKEGENVSLVALLANPEKYDGMRVRVIGFLNLEFEGDAIYLHEEDYLAGIDVNSLWVHVNQSKLTNAPKCNKKYVVIEGVFDAKDTGHMGMFGGAIKDITRLDLWHQPVRRK